MNKKKKRLKILFLSFIAVLLTALGAPATLLEVAAWDQDSISVGSTVSVGETITCSDSADKTVCITYYNSSGEQLAKQEGDKLTVQSYYDSGTGAYYEEYTVTSKNNGDTVMEISLQGISPDVENTHTLSGIYVSQAPTKTTYTSGDVFDSTGMVITAYYSDNTWRNVTGYTVTPSGKLTKSTKYVTIEFTESGVTAATTQSITVKAKSSTSYTISASAAAGGYISDEGDSSVKKGNDKTYTITPYSGYVINYVEVDGNNVGAVSSYEFEDVDDDHTIAAYFVYGSAVSSANKKTLTVIGSFAAASGAGQYAQGASVAVDAGTVPGFVFAGWLASDGLTYPSSAFSLTMPGYDLILYANWVQAGTQSELYQAVTTNLKGTQLSGWTEITNKLASFSAEDLETGGAVMKVAVGGVSCYIDAGAVAVLNTRQGVAMEVSYGEDISFTFYSDLDNSLFTETDFTCAFSTSSNPIVREKNVTFTQTGALNTGVYVNVLLSDATPGQTAYVYLVDGNGNEIMYLPVIVDSENRVSIPMAAKINLSIKY
ncbi:MAG: hypothetical protein LUE96_08055 [Lachnospiraceae bacterium]|nr:hypothetical protein [Lachnospiraceae bacterium]